MTTIVKRRGHSQDFDERKVYASVYAACLNVHLTQTEAEEIAGKVTQKVKGWLGDKKEVTAAEIFDFVTNTLEKYNQHAAFMYHTHRDVS